MRDRLIDGLIQGDRLAWAAIAAVWALTTVVVLLHRPLGESQTSGRRAAWTWLLFVVATGTSLAGLPLSAAIAVPQVRWATVDAPDLVAPGGESWRRLRGPAVMVAGPDLAIPTLDAEGRWVLMGLLSGKPAPGLPAAEPAPMKPGAPTLCLPTGEACRPWPVSWPDPTRPTALGELSWSRAGSLGDPHGSAVADALAYDVETGLYLRRIDPAPSARPDARATLPTLEVAGRLTGEPTREGGAALVVVRKVAGGRLKEVRVVATPAALGWLKPGAPAGSGQAFAVQRAEVSLTAGPRVFAWAVQPLLVLTSLSLPLGVLALLLAPLLHQWRRRRARKRGQPPYRRSEPGDDLTRREAAAWVAPYLEAAAVLAAGVAAAAPAVVAIAGLWGSR